MGAAHELRHAVLPIAHGGTAAGGRICSASGYASGVARIEHRYDATPFLPERRSLKSLREAAASCRGCHLYAGATQTVFGDGLKRAKVMFVGEMPGDKEDRAGRVFVGPAGRELDKALELVGIVRADVYITNVVKHFKFEERGKRRIHQKPKKGEVDACLPWLRAELSVVRPQALVILGATAGKALLGSSFRLSDARGQPVDSELAEFVTATTHPSAILRAPDDEARHAERRAFTRDLQRVAEYLDAGR
jgi:uracil-DNA glycosylase